MEKKNVYLNEENYQRTVKKISLVAKIILIIGLCVGGYLIYNGIMKPNSSNVEMLQKRLEERKQELLDKGIVYSSFAKYTDGERYDLKIITDALDPSFDYCAFDEYKNNSITNEYCSAKNSVGEFASISFVMFGVFICIASCMVSFTIFMIAKRRNVLAFTAQQTMPVAEEVMETMAPKFGNLAKENMETMAPTVGNLAKEVAKGIKEGLSDDEQK